MSLPDKFFYPILAKTNQGHAVVSVVDVVRCPPQITSCGPPSPWCFHSPIANAKYDRTPGLCQRVAEFRVLHLRNEPFRIAPIDLYVIDPPGGIRLRVLCFVVQATRSPLTGERARICIDP